MQKIEPGQFVLEEQVKSSSSDSVYTVRIYENCMSCNCPAGSKKTLCKHMLSVVKNNESTITENAQILKSGISQILALKSMPRYSKEELKKLSANFIYVNKEIAEAGHENAQRIKNSTKKDFENIVDLIESNFSENEKEILLRILYTIKPHLFKTVMYLKRRLGKVKQTEFYDLSSETFYIQEEDYIAGGELVDNLLKKYEA